MALAIEVAYVRPGVGNLKVEFTITVPAGTVFYRLVDADTKAVLATATENFTEPSTITRSFTLDMLERNLWMRLEVGTIVDTTETVEAYYAFPTWTWYDVTVEAEEVEGAAASGDWTSYKAKIKYDEKALPENFITQLMLDKYVVSAVRMMPDVYDPATFDLAIAFQVPPLDVGTHSLKLNWYGQAFAKDAFSYAIPPGNSAGVNFTLAKPIGLLVGDESVEHPQAPGHWSSYHATMTDADGQSLPSRFYVILMMHTPTPVNVVFTGALLGAWGTYVGRGDGVKKEFSTKYYPIVADTLTVYMDGVAVAKTAYTVDYALGKITFNTAPAKRSLIQADYTANLIDFPIAVVNLRRDVYFGNKVKFAFKVPDAVPAGSYSVWLEWDDQVIGDKKYLKGRSVGTTLNVLGIVRTITITGEATEKTIGIPGLKLSYTATMADDLANALPAKTPVRLIFEPSISPAIEEYLKPLKIYVKDTGVWHEAFTKYFKVYEKGTNWTRVGFEAQDQGAGETPDWDFDDPKLYLEVLSPTTVRITVESFTESRCVELWYGYKQLTGAVEVTSPPTSFETDFKIIVSAVFLKYPNPADPTEPYIYDPVTKLASIAFEVPSVPVGSHLIRLEWDNTVIADTKYLEGKSTGFTFSIIPPTTIVVTDESVEHPQAVAQKVSYTAKICDKDGASLPRGFYIKLFMDGVQVAGVNLAPDVYDTASKYASISFTVPEGTASGWKLLKLKWDKQVADGKAFPEGESAGVQFGVTSDMRTVDVSNVSIDKPYLTPTLNLAYYATMQDNLGNALPHEEELTAFPTQLLLNSTVVAAPRLFGAIYDSATKKVSISFEVPAETAAGEHNLTIKWPDYVYAPAANPLGTKYEGGSYTVKVTVLASTKVSVSNESIEHPQAPGQNVSYIATLQDEAANALPEEFYVRLMLDEILLSGVNLKPDVYDPAKKLAKISFQVPADLAEGNYTTKLSWDTQVIGTKGYIHGESAGATLQVTKDIRNVYVALEPPEWVEKSPLKPGESTTYHATVIDERDEPLLPTFATELLLDGAVLTGATFNPTIYNSVTREAKIAFTVPLGTPAGAYRVKLKWPSQVCNSTKYEEASSVGAVIEVV